MRGHLARARVRTLAAALGACLLIPGASRAQIIQQSGHALDASLRLGSGGYNGPVSGGRAYLQNKYYVPRQPSIDYYNAFERQRYYTPSRATAAERADSPGDYRSWSPANRPNPARQAAPTWDPGYDPALAPPPINPPPPVPPADLPSGGRTSSQKDLLSYAIGFVIGREIREGLGRDGVEVDEAPLIEGFGDGCTGREPSLGREGLAAVLAAIRENVDARAVQGLSERDPRFRSLLARNLAESRSFHQEFSRRDGVVTLPDGIQYQVLATGKDTGRTPLPEDRVRVHYRLLGIDGQELIAHDRDLVVKDTVPGAAKILQMMRPGDRWLVAIPPDLAFGSRGHPPEIEPNETVLGEIELLEVKE